MQKNDYKKLFKDFYSAPTREVREVIVPTMNFLMIDGKGDPNTSTSFQQAVEALYTVSYTLKFAIKKSTQTDYGVMPLEGLWWADDMTTFSVDRKSEWKWTLMIMQPEPVTEDRLITTLDEVRKKKNPVALSRLRFESFTEGKAAQIMHVGPFSEEGPTVEKVHAFIEQRGGKLTGKHHEIYLSDIRRAAPEKWKTIIRQPMV